MPIAKTHVNLPLKTNKDSLHATIFKNKLAASTLRNNKNQITRRRHQGRSMVSMKVKVAKYTKSTGSDPTALRRWNFVDGVNGEKNM